MSTTIDDTPERQERLVTLAEEFLRTPWDAEVLCALEAHLVGAQEWTAIIEVANEAMEGADDATKVALSLALARWYGVVMDRAEYAVPYLKHAYSLLPNDSRVRRAGGLNLRQRKQPELALAELQAAFDAASDAGERAEICGDLAAVALDLGQEEQARWFHELALRCDPTCTRARDALALLPQPLARPAEVPSAPDPHLAEPQRCAGVPSVPEAASAFGSKPPWARD